MHLADQRGWAGAFRGLVELFGEVFDNSIFEPENPCVVNLAEIEPGCTLTMWRGEVDELAKTIGLKFRQEINGDF